MNNRHNSMADSAGMTLMDLISSDPTPLAPPSPSSSSSSSPAAMPPPSSGTGKHATTDRKSKRGALLQIQSDTISAAKAALNPVRTNILPQKHNQRKKSVSYAQLERSIHELAATSDQKTSQKQLVHHVFPKLAVYNSVDPSLAPSLLMLDQECEDRTVLRYVYYYLARILADPGSQGLTSGGGIPTPNWDAFADIDAVGAVTRADVAPRIVDRLTSEALNADVEYFGAAGDLGRIDKAVSHHEGEEVEIEYEVDGWFYVKKKRPGRDGKLAGLVPVLYVSQS